MHSFLQNLQDARANHKKLLAILIDPDKIEITNGVSEGDLLVYGNRSNIGVGMKITPKLIDATGG